MLIIRRSAEDVFFHEDIWWKLLEKHLFKGKDVISFYQLNFSFLYAEYEFLFSMKMSSE